MAKTKISEFSATPGNNTDIDGINIAEGCAPSGINDAIRELMAQLKDFQTGAAGDSFNGPVGTTTAAAGSFTTLAYTGALTGGTGVVNLGSGQFYKDASGNVGIGTSSPDARLHVQNSQGGGIGRVLIDANVSSGYDARITATDVGLQFSAQSNTRGFAFSTGVTPTERARITSDGDLGIGSAAPTNRLHVVGATENTNAASGTGVARFQGGLSTYSGYIGFDGSTMSIGTNATNRGLSFVAGAAERARIDSSGNLLVGTTSPTNNSRLAVAFGTGNDGIVTSVGASTGQTHIRFVNSNGAVGSISTSGSSTAYNTSSDYRLKHDIAPMTGALAKVTALKPVTYKWNADGSDGEGFIAHELAEVVPDCVTGEKDAVETFTDENGVEQTRPVYQGIDTSFLVATLTAAIQEQQAIITALTARVAALESAAT